MVSCLDMNLQPVLFSLETVLFSKFECTKDCIDTNVPALVFPHPALTVMKKVGEDECVMTETLHAPVTCGECVAMKL